MSTLERIWITYAVLVVAIACLGGGGGDESFRPWSLVGVNAGVVVAAIATAWIGRRHGERAGRIARSAMALVGLPVVFGSLACVLPAVHPEPWEWTWAALDRCWLGDDVSRLVRERLPDSVVLPLQLVYASFYFVPIAATLVVARARGRNAFDRALMIFTGCFLISYVGYLLFPTLAPKVVLPRAEDAGVGVAAVVRRWIDTAEANPWDCFPSGHTMLSIVSVVVVWRWARRCVALFVVVVVPLIFSTVALRYHWPVDVLAGALLAWPSVWLCDRLGDRDGMAPA